MEGLIVVFFPVGLLEFGELSFDIISLSLDVMEGCVVDVDTFISLLDMTTKCVEEFFDLSIELLTLFGLSELLIELIKMFSLFSAS